ncbi:WD repeat-containing protein 35 [Halyomorpha halys]|uniref:WD repeat-containing protein 35 n=1 Tax=Halyomorpha halys TaxID=286706 RepID=UPI0006D4E906|nr:WD repeat-containing protein 35 [Halyomorpha halys]
MFTYLCKKISMPNNTRIYCLAWSSEQGWIGLGGDDGLLKVLKLESGKTKGITAPANLSMNQTLEGHSGKVQVITWNEQHQKFTTSDQNGLIIVWTMYKGNWYEEMINNRNKSVVKGMSWDSEGKRICIVYEDGAVIVGSVDGNRIWGKELKGLILTGVQWSPDGRYLVFSLKNGEVHLYDNQGNFFMKLSIQCFPSLVITGIPVVSMAWYDGRNGYVENNCPCLAILYQTGQLQIMRNQNDEDPVILDTGISAVNCSWNHNGNILAIVGSSVFPDDNKETNVVVFYSLYGEHIRTMKLPGRVITTVVWEGTSLRIALAVDSFIYFAIIRPDYKWAYFSKTLVFSHSSRTGTEITFWDTNNNEVHHKQVKFLYAINAFKEHCAIAFKTDDMNEQYMIHVCNTIGITVDSKSIDIEPLWISINTTQIFCASKDHFMIWHFMTPKSHSTLGITGRHRRERLYHIDDTPSGVAEVIQDLDKTYQPNINMQATNDPICCITVSDKILVIGRESGSLQRYSLPQVALVQRFTLGVRPKTIAVNCDSTRIAVIDTNGVLTTVDMESSVNSKLERRDVWALKWASDNPDLLAIMEKTRMYVIRGSEPEEPIQSSGYICCFKDLEIRTVLLDDIMSNPDVLTIEDHILDLEVKSLRDTRQLLEKVGINEATAFIEQNPHPRLWHLLAEAAVKKLDIKTAETAFVHCSDYPGLQLIKRLNNITNDQIKKAQVAAYFGDFNEAEKLYLDADRRDLAVSLRERLGDWFRVIQLMKMGSGGSDSQLQYAWNSIGDFFADRNNWDSAKEYYEKSGNIERMIKCYQLLEDYDLLQKLATQLPEKHQLLKEIAEIFVSVGMCSQAVSTFVKFGSVESAVEACVSLNEWDQAVTLAETYSMLPEIGTLLDKYALGLLERDRHLEAIQLYRKANRFLEAAKLMFQLAENEAKRNLYPIRTKKLYVLAALLVEEQIKMKKVSTGEKRDALIRELHEENITDFKITDNPWRGAEAYHFLMLAQRQLYEGNSNAAVLTSIHLRRYEDILPPETVYCIIALAAVMAKAYATASKAYMKLESLPALTENKQEEYADLAVQVFTKHIPNDPKGLFLSCSTCKSSLPTWSGLCEGCDTRYPVCIVTGRPLLNLESSAWTCHSCSHSSSFSDIGIKQFCPLCHSHVRR